MAYQDLLLKESVNSQFLVIMRPRRIVSSAWTLVSGTTYKTSFEFGQVTECRVNGEPLSNATSPSLSSNEWYFDDIAFEIYVNSGVDPNSQRVILDFELYFSTFDAHWFRIPDDDTSRVVYYEPLVTRSPQVISSSQDGLFGFLPTFSTSLSLSNLTNYLQKLIFDSSFNRAPVEVWNYLDDLEIDNLKKVFDGFSSEISITDESVTFTLLDSTSFLDQEWRNPDGVSFYSLANFPFMDPNFVGRPVRWIYGVVDGFRPVNVDYHPVDPATADNLNYICTAGISANGTQNFTASSGSHTTKRTYVSSIVGIQVGDTVWNITRNDSFLVTAIGADYLDHTASTTAVSGDSLQRSFVGRVDIFKDGRKETLLYGKHYIELLDFVSESRGFSIDPGVIAAFSYTSNIQVSDIITARVYGRKNSVLLNGSPFKGNSLRTGTMTSLAAIFYETILQILPESKINYQSFENIVRDDEIGFAIPEQSSQDFPSIKELISQFCQTGLFKFFLDEDLKWKVSEINPVTTETISIEDDEILERSINYKIDYRDLVSRVEVNYRSREVGDDGGLGKPLIAASESDTALELHRIERKKSFKSLHLFEDEALVLAERLSLIFGDRRGILQLSTKNRFFDTILDDVLKVSRSRMIGFDFDADVLRERNFLITEVKKSLTEVSLELDDLKGATETLWP